MKRIMTVINLLLAGAVLIAGCGTQPTAGAGLPPATPTPSVSHGGPVKDYASFVDALRAAGATVEPAEQVEQPFFTVKGQIVKVNGADVQVFEFQDEAAAQTAARGVGPDGSTFETTIVTWIAPPHFFQAGRIIVLYVGQDTGVLRLLAATLGPQFAGQ